MSFRQSVPGRKVPWAMRPELPSHWAVRQQWDCKRKADLEVRSHFNTCVELCKKSWHMRGTHTWSLCCLYSRDNSVTDYLCLPVSTHKGQAPCGGSCCMMGAQRTLCACNISVPLQKKKRLLRVGSAVWKTPATVTEVTLISKGKPFEGISLVGNTKLIICRSEGEQ